MKGFPNQLAELPKIATAIRCLVDIENQGKNGKDDGVFGEELVRAGVAGTGHRPRPVEAYLAEQRKKPKSSQSFRTTARGLRELYRILGLIDDSGPDLIVTEESRRHLTVNRGTEFRSTFGAVLFAIFLMPTYTGHRIHIKPSFGS